MSMTFTSSGTFPESNERASTGPMNEGRVIELNCRLGVHRRVCEFLGGQVVPVQVDARGSYQAPVESNKFRCERE